MTGLDEKYFYVPKMYIRTVIKSTPESGLTSFIWKGEPGIGKSHTTMQTLEELGLRNKKDYAVLSGYTTPLELYTFLYENREKIVVLDDIPNVFENETSYHILLSALWTVTSERMIYYLTSSPRLKVPNSFNFKGKIIFLTNRMPADSSSLRSRCMFYEMNLTFWDKLELMEEIARTTGISPDVMQFIRENANETTKNFNLRTMVKINSLFLQNIEDWRRLALEQLREDETLRLIRQLCRSYEKSTDQVKLFTEATGLSRATFFRLKGRLATDRTHEEE